MEYSVESIVLVSAAMTQITGIYTRFRIEYLNHLCPAQNMTQHTALDKYAIDQNDQYANT